MKKTTTTTGKQIRLIYIIFTAIIIIWMTLLTFFSIWAWNQHMWQTKSDNETIFKLLVENAEQQVQIDELLKANN